MNSTPQVPGMMTYYPLLAVLPDWKTEHARVSHGAQSPACSSTALCAAAACSAAAAAAAAAAASALFWASDFGFDASA